MGWQGLTTFLRKIPSKGWIGVAKVSMYSIMDHMENNTYNGYTNRATWNLMLWISNDECAYHFFRDLYFRIGGDHPDDRQDMIESYAREWFGQTTPDRDRLSDVDWQEVREHLDDDNSDILEEFAAEVA
jgi:hypothetical protein